MGFMGRKSILKSDVIQKAVLNRKDYKYLDFYFKIVPGEYERNFSLEVYNFESHILSLEFDEEYRAKDKFRFRVFYFNPQTDNDCYSINHIIACLTGLATDENKDYGNADVFRNEFVLRRKDSYYGYTKLWARGDIRDDNYHKSFSYEFATNEYLQFVKEIYDFKRMQKRKLKSQFQAILDKLIMVKRLERK